MSTNVILPHRLTAEDGAKGMLSGEFYIDVEVPCPRCHEHGHDDSCSDCDGEGFVSDQVAVPWETIKDIYTTIVDNFSQPCNQDELSNSTLCLQGHFNNAK